jgi:hypothetical protein
VSADRRRARGLYARGGEEPDAHRVDEAVVRVRLVEDRFAADRRDADGVPVVADSRHGAAEGVVGRAEPEPVQDRDRACAHCDDVPEDPADARGGPLERLDRRRVVVRLHLERQGLAVAEVDHARVLARALEYGVAPGGQPLQQQRRMLVAAVLRPEEGEDRELEAVRIPAEQLHDPGELPVRQPQRTVQRLFRCDLRQGS